MGEQHNRQGKQSAIWCAPTEHVEVTFGVASLFKVVVNGGLEFGAPWQERGWQERGRQERGVVQGG